MFCEPVVLKIGARWPAAGVWPTRDGRVVLSGVRLSEAMTET